METGKFALCGIISHRPLWGRCQKRIVTETFLVACYTTLDPALFVRWSVGPCVGKTLLFLGLCGLWPNDQETSNTAPAYPHVTEVAVLFS